MTARILVGGALEQLRTFPDDSVHCVVTSPPYWGLRDYGVEGQIGLEKTPEEFVTKLVEVFREVRRVLRADGTCWVNMGDSYAGAGGQSPQSGALFKGRARQRENVCMSLRSAGNGLKPKDLVGMPWMLAFALRADGWYLRQEIIWAKRNTMPESVRDRCTKAHEQIFLLSKAERYFYDPEAISEPASESTHARLAQDVAAQAGTARANGGTRADRPLKALAPKLGAGQKGMLNEPGSKQNESFMTAISGQVVGRRNKRSVWWFGTEPFKGAHFAVFPSALPRTCIEAGTSARGCCPTCGAPWVREVERTPMVLERSERTHELGRSRSSGTMVEPPTSTTTGWRPVCACYGTPPWPVCPPEPDTYDTPEQEAEYLAMAARIGAEQDALLEAYKPLRAVACTVLDPFAGAGTTLLVAERLHRDSIGIELNPEFAALARDRIHGDAPLLTDVTVDDEART